ncbi:MAG: metallophosphoesterase family protein [Lentisphaerales bacterium]|nr:metallophosphoesterase family protein [Lentisphaerales bacterium]
MKFKLLLMVCLCLVVMAQAKSKSSEELKEVTKKLTRLEGTVPAQWRVIWTGDAAHEATVSWTTAEAGKEHFVYFGKSKQAMTEKVKSHRDGQYTLTSSDKKKKVGAAYYHHVKLSNLKPSTKYFFYIKSDAEKSRVFYFETAPEKGEGFSIIHGGDSRSGLLDRCKINQKIASFVEAEPKVLAFAHGGDYVVKGHWGLWRLWLSHHELTTCEDGRILPIIATRGNHDGGPVYKEIFDILPDQPDWHVTTLGESVTMITLDTNVSGGGEQSLWLEEQLKKYRPTSKWLLTQYHRPLYPAVKSAPAHTKIFCPLFDKYNVDLACEADGHNIKRTIPIRDGKPDATGVVYIGEGGLGVGQRKPKKDLWYLKDGVVGQDHHFMVLDFGSQKLRIRTILLDGKLYDDHSLSVRK